MASIAILGAVGLFIFTIIIIMCVVIYGSRSRINNIDSQISEHSEALDLISDWAMAAQEQIQVPGYGGAVEDEE